MREALKAAKRMMKLRGYVVLCLTHWSLNTQRVPGDTFSYWCGAYLGDYELIVTGKTNGADWDAQFVAIFGKRKKDTNEKHRRDRFYRCELRKIKP
jgi:hypothetical protein